MFLVGYLAVKVVDACHSVLPTPHAFWHWGLNISRGGGLREQKGVRLMREDSGGSCLGRQFGSVRQGKGGPVVSLVSGRCPWKKPVGVG